MAPPHEIFVPIEFVEEVEESGTETGTETGTGGEKRVRAARMARPSGAGSGSEAAKSGGASRVAGPLLLSGVALDEVPVVEGRAGTIDFAERVPVEKPAFTLPPPAARSDSGFATIIDEDGRIHFQDQPSVEFGILDHKVELTDLVMRAVGQDPYAAQKLRIAERTRPMRAAMRVQADARNMRQTLFGLGERLDAIWARKESATARRRLLFQLWDEALENGAGLEARGIISGFIRRRGIVYPPAELESLNRSRTSREPFAPTL